VRVDDDEQVVDLGRKRRKREEMEPHRFLSSDARREAVGFVLIAVAVILFASLILNPSELRGIATSAAPSPAGRFGRWIATRVGLLFGFGGLVIPLSLGAWGHAIFQRRPPRSIFAKGLALTVGLLSTCAFLGLVRDGGFLGGALGDRLAWDLYRNFGVVSFLVVLFTGVISLVIGTSLSFSAVALAAWRGAGMVWRWGVALEERLVERILVKRGELAETTPARKAAGRKEKAKETAEEADGDLRVREYFENAETRIISTPALKVLNGKAGAIEKTETSEAVATTAEPSARKIKLAEKPKATTPVIEEDYLDDDKFTLPGIDLLENPVPSTAPVTEEDLHRKAEGLRETLADFGVDCKIGDIVPGPTVTRFEVIPAPGVKVGSVTALSDDISLAMAAPSIRIEAPIPGKAAIGIEIPNRKGNKVTIKEVVATEEFRAMREQSPLTVALGQDIAGRAVVADLRKMPHLLIAGSTGSGKSVCINSIINSILLSASPTEVKMLMVDPKVVELQDYNDVPHLLAPVVTDARKAPQVLLWAVDEMERRYRYLARSGVRDIESFNALVPEPVAPKAEADADAIDDFDDIADDAALAEALDLPERLPYILVVVDEFADLMMVAAKECEDAITRIAQMARAVGIHLIIATQRPSVDVITGIIKANLPSRISFQVSSKIDSRTILDSMGAERLLGAGDMLFKPGDKPKPLRLQGCFIGGNEIKRVVGHFAAQGKARRLCQIESVALENGDRNNLAGADDPLLTEAMRIALADGMASVSRIQRRLKVGHPRAARLVDIMEAKGLVTPPDGSKPRKLLFDDSYFQSEDGGGE
jgi:S-DNA-T family DNA segregation ATPase FtsK/SpoIIIE